MLQTVMVLTVYTMETQPRLSLDMEGGSRMWEFGEESRSRFSESHFGQDTYI